MNKAISGVILDGSGATLQTAQPITWDQAEDGMITLTVLKQDGTPFDLTGYTGILAVKRSRLTTAPLFPQRANANAPGALGVLTFGVAKVDTINALYFGTYVYDVYITEIATNKSYKVVPESTFTLVKSIANPSGGVTAAAGTAALVGMPTPTPAYPAIPAWSGSAYAWKQRQKVTVVFNGTVAQMAAAWTDFAARPFVVLAGAPRVTAGGPVSCEVIAVSSVGCTVQATAVFTGEIDLVVEEI